MVVVFPLQKENESENGDVPGEQAEVVLCLHSDSEGASEEEDHETSEQEDNYSGVESVSSAEQEEASADSEEQVRPQSPPNAQEDNVMEDEMEGDHLSNNSREEGSAPHDTQDLPLPAEVPVQVTNNSLCEGDSHAASPPKGDSPTALDHQEDVQVGPRRSIVVPMEGSGDESFEVILCGGEMEAPIAMMEAPTKATNGRKGKRKSKGEANTNGDGSPPSKSPKELKSSVTGSAKKRKQTPSRQLLAKKKKQKRTSSIRKSAQDSIPSATSSTEVNTDMLQAVSSTAPSQPSVLSITPLQRDQGTTPGPSSILKKWKSKSVPSKCTKNKQTDCNNPYTTGGVLTADLSEVEVFSVESEWQSTSVPRKHSKRRTSVIRKMGNVFAADLNEVEVYSD